MSLASLPWRHADHHWTSTNLEWQPTLQKSGLTTPKYAVSKGMTLNLCHLIRPLPKSFTVSTVDAFTLKKRSWKETKETRRTKPQCLWFRLSAKDCKAHDTVTRLGNIGFMVSVWMLLSAHSIPCPVGMRSCWGRCVMDLIFLFYVYYSFSVSLACAISLGSTHIFLFPCQWGLQMNFLKVYTWLSQPW